MSQAGSSNGPTSGNEPRPPHDKRSAVADAAIGFLVLVLFVSPIVFLLFSPTHLLDPRLPDTVPLSQAAAEVRGDRIQRIVVDGDALQLTRTDGSKLRTLKEPRLTLPETLREYGVPEQQILALQIEVRPSADLSWALNFVWAVPAVLVLLMLLRQAAQGGEMGSVRHFLRSRAPRSGPDRPTVCFEDVAGVGEAKEELREIVSFLRQPDKFAALGARIPRGVLLAGPPGTGKTLLARAVAGEADVPFLSINASEFVELFVGVGARRVRDLFQQARDHAPAIVFIDEIDAIGRRRGTGLAQTHEEREQTLNQILAELDGFDQRANVIVMAATNRPDVLDPALLRPGRFDRRVLLDNPDREGRLAILQVHARGKPFQAGIDLAEVARATAGFSGADLENLLNEAALLAARRDLQAVGPDELEEAADRVMAGPRRRGHALTPQERELIAYHEAGHALVAHRLPHADPVHRVSIVARGQAGGHTWLLPGDEHRFWSRSQLHDVLAYSLGGLMAEELIYGESTTGPCSDLEQASGLARRMVLEYGMSARLGPVALVHQPAAESSLGFEPGGYSEQTAATVDAEVQQLMGAAHDRACQVLGAERPLLAKLVAELLERETLHREDLDRLLGAPASARPSAEPTALASTPVLTGAARIP